MHTNVINSNDFDQNENVKIDLAHSFLVTALVAANKPRNILEFGVGGGRSTEAILDGLLFNAQTYNFTLVDNWLDWGGRMPPKVQEKFNNKLNIITSDEKKFVFDCKDKYDFIMSDADHEHTNDWFQYVYDNLLEEGGILIYHDINLFERSWPNLREIFTACQKNGYTHLLFNKSSRPDERCHRGLLVIFKNKK